MKQAKNLKIFPKFGMQVKNKAMEILLTEEEINIISLYASKVQANIELAALLESSQDVNIRWDILYSLKENRHLYWFKER